MDKNFLASMIELLVIAILLAGAYYLGFFNMIEQIELIVQHLSPPFAH